MQETSTSDCILEAAQQKMILSFKNILVQILASKKTEYKGVSSDEISSLLKLKSFKFKFSAPKDTPHPDKEFTLVFEGSLPTDNKKIAILFGTQPRGTKDLHPLEICNTWQNCKEEIEKNWLEARTPKKFLVVLFFPNSEIKANGWIDYYEVEGIAPLKTNGPAPSESQEATVFHLTMIRIFPTSTPKSTWAKELNQFFQN